MHMHIILCTLFTEWRVHCVRWLQVRARGGDLLVHFSDVDELVDLPMLERAVRRVGAPALFGAMGCRTPALRNYYFSEFCPSHGGGMPATGSHYRGSHSARAHSPQSACL